MNIKQIIFFSLLCFSMNLSANQVTEKYYSDLANITDRIFCNDKITLSYIDKDYKNCLPYINSLSKKCITRFTRAMPDFESVEEYIKHNELVTNLTELYIICVKAKIFEDIEKVVMVKEIGLLSKKVTEGLNFNQFYTNDTNSNRLQYTQDGVPVTYLYEPNTNRLTQAANDPVSLDANGNTIQRGDWTYIYNEDNTCDLEFVREMPSRDGKTKSCIYKRKGTMFTFQQAVGYSCPPINKEKCMVDTRYIMPPAKY